MATELAILDEGPTQLSRVESWDGAAARGLAARAERNRIIANVLVEGEDYGIIPGTDKPTLYKSGAEKVTDALGLYAQYDELERREDWDPGRPLFFYRYRCLLTQRGSSVIIATGIGSCNSMESRYRWRDSKRKCPKCAKETIFNSKNDGGGYFCWAKKGGCGAQFLKGDTGIEKQEIGRVENDDVFTLVNTVDKMAQKRALVAANLNLGFSAHFTQDVEDMGDERAVVEEKRPAAASNGNGGDHGGAPLIDDPQYRKIWAVARKRWSKSTDEVILATLNEIAAEYKYGSIRQVRVTDFERVCAAIEDHVSA